MRVAKCGRWWRLAAVVSGLAACAVAPPAQQGTSFPSSAVTPPPPVPHGTSAVIALSDAATGQMLDGDYEQAAASLERALRLEPRNAMLWHRLAQVRLGQRQWRDAIDLAAKSNSLAGGRHDLQASNWLVIAQAKQRQGDREGAAAARVRAEGGSATK